MLAARASFEPPNERLPSETKAKRIEAVKGQTSVLKRWERANLKKVILRRAERRHQRGGAQQDARTGYGDAEYGR